MKEGSGLQSKYSRVRGGDHEGEIKRMGKVSSKLSGRSWSVMTCPGLDRATCFGCIGHLLEPPKEPSPHTPFLIRQTGWIHPISSQLDQTVMIGEAPSMPGAGQRGSVDGSIPTVQWTPVRWSRGGNGTTSRPCCNRSQEGTGVAFGAR